MKCLGTSDLTIKIKNPLYYTSVRYFSAVHLSVGPTVFRGPRNIEPSRGIWVFMSRAGELPADFSRGITRGFYPRNSSFRGFLLLAALSFPRPLTFFIRTTKKMTSMLMAD